MTCTSKNQGLWRRKKKWLGDAMEMSASPADPLVLLEENTASSWEDSTASDISGRQSEGTMGEPNVTQRCDGWADWKGAPWWLLIRRRQKRIFLAEDNLCKFLRKIMTQLRKHEEASQMGLRWIQQEKVPGLRHGDSGMPRSWDLGSHQKLSTGKSCGVLEILSGFSVEGQGTRIHTGAWRLVSRLLE